MNNLLRSILIVILGIGCLILGIRTLKSPESDVVKTHSDTVINIVHDTVTYHAKSNIKIVSSITVSVPIIPTKADTEAILRRYFSKYVYSDSLKDSNMVASVIDTVSQNKIISRAFYYKILKAIKVESIVNTTNIYPVAKNNLSIGGFAYISKMTNAAGPLLQYAHADFCYGGGYDLLNKGLHFNLTYKVSHW